jgi:hypothetical protein
VLGHDARKKPHQSGRGAAFDDVYANDGVASDELNSLVFIYESLCAVGWLNTSPGQMS